MIQGRVHHGQIELKDGIPESWEGQWVKIEPLTPDDPLPDLDLELRALHEMGPMEFDEKERESIARELAELDRASRDAMRRLGHTR